MGVRKWMEVVMELGSGYMGLGSGYMGLGVVILMHFGGSVWASQHF